MNVPTAESIVPGEICKLPLTWAEQCFDLRQHRVHDSGGHFAPPEVPDVYVDDVRSFFRGLR